MNNHHNLLRLLSVFPAVILFGQPIAAQPRDAGAAPAHYQMVDNGGGNGPMANQELMEFDFPDEVEDFGTAAFGADETISVDFPDEEIRTILRNVADLYDLNLVIPDTLQGRTSIKLRNVTWREVFEVILEPIGFTYVEDRSIVKVKSLEDLAAEPVDTRVFMVNYADAARLQESISMLVDPAIGGRIQVDARSNALVITERPTRMNNIQEIIERLDRPTEQVMIESKFVEVANRDLSNIGVNWTSMGGYGVTAGPFNRGFQQTSTGTNVVDTVRVGDPPGAASVTLADLFERETSRITSAVFSADAFNVVLSALASVDDIKLISNPTVVTLNNTEALIAIGERFPIPQYTFNDERGTFEVSGFDYTDIGINLRVRPQVNAAGFISLDIRPEVSNRAGTVNFGGAAGAEIPIISSRRTESNITIKDGFTLAIGGLVENQTRKGESKIPVLGDIPGFGRLFKSTTVDSEQRNLIVFITARTLNPDGSTYKEIIDPRVLHQMGITDRDVPGYQVPERERQILEQIAERRRQFFDRDAARELQQKLDVLEGANTVRERDRTNIHRFDLD